MSQQVSAARDCEVHRHWPTDRLTSVNSVGLKAGLQRVLQETPCCGTSPRDFASLFVEWRRRMIFLRPLRFLATALVLETTPRQLAWGFALGMLIGLIPKGNLIAVGLMMLFCALRINAAAGTAAICLFTFAGMYLDP